ncbi:MFS transporter [Aspergillus germanicus]
MRPRAHDLLCSPFLGPILDPIVGGFVAQSVRWKWVQGVCVILIGVMGPVLLQRRGRQLATADKSGGCAAVYVSVLEKNQGKKTPSEVFQRALFPPWIFLFVKPIVLIASLYIAIIYGTIYKFMGAMPIVYNETCGWSRGVDGLAFLGIAVGIILGLVYAVWDNNTRYVKLFAVNAVTPESRPPPAIIGAVALPDGMFTFAWTYYPAIHWSVSIVLSAPFGFGCVLVILPIITYLIDAYTIYAASVLAAWAIFRSVIGAVFRLFTARMYHNLGIHWASSIPAFLTLVYMPFPFVMYRYGELMRMKCKYSFEAAEMMRKMQVQQTVGITTADKESASG